jgi:hypothetical protein
LKYPAVASQVLEFNGFSTAQKLATLLNTRFHAGCQEADLAFQQSYPQFL